MNPSFREYDRAELIADGIIHVIGVLLAVGGAIGLVLVNLGHAEPGAFLARIIYALTLITTLTMSAIYNMWPDCPLKWSLRKYDHAAIFLLIAGTYTPFVLQAKETGLLLFVWTAALLGVGLKIAFAGQFDRLTIVLYLGLGWGAAALFEPLFNEFSPALPWLLLGGIVYTVGVVFHLWRGLRFQNAIWHAFVLGGASLHYSAVMAAM